MKTLFEGIFNPEDQNLGEAITSEDGANGMGPPTVLMCCSGSGGGGEVGYVGGIYMGGCVIKF